MVDYLVDRSVVNWVASKVDTMAVRTAVVRELSRVVQLVDSKVVRLVL